MTPPIGKTQGLWIIGIIAMLVALIGDSYLHLSLPVLAAVGAVAIVCFMLSYRAARPVQRPSAPVPLRRKHQRFAILFAAVLVGFILGSFVLPTHTPRLSLATRVLIDVSLLPTLTGILVWQVYFRRGKDRSRLR